MQATDVVVVGGGMAGLTAAAQLGRLGLRCVTFTGSAPGGLLLSIESVEGLAEHPGGVPGYDLCPMAQEAAMEAGVAFVDESGEVLQRDGALWVVRSATSGVQTRAVVLASGGRLRPLGVPGEERLVGRGVSHCANCDGPLLRGKPVAVVGSGDAACQEALTLAAHASTVHLLARGSGLRARASWQERVRAQPKIQLHPAATVQSIEGGNAVEAVQLADGRRLSVDAVFVYAGLRPNTEWLRGLVALDAQGRIEADAVLHASEPGLFAAGIVRSGHSGQAADAIADGHAVAAAVHSYLAEGR